jgi:hypothetical protein
MPIRGGMKANTAKNSDGSDVVRVPEPTTIVARRVRLVADAATATSSLIWEPASARSGGAPSTDEVLHRRLAADVLPADIEQTIITTLTRPLRADESHLIGNENRERELRTIFTRLTPIQALQLRRRLDADRIADPLAAAFRRIIIERRQRLRTFLASPRRHLG